MRDRIEGRMMTKVDPSGPGAGTMNEPFSDLSIGDQAVASTQDLD
jgi:hypothetical protein